MQEGFGLGLSGKNWNDVPDWEFFGYDKPQDFALYINFQKTYEVDCDDDEE